MHIFFFRIGFEVGVLSDELCGGWFSWLIGLWEKIK